jgi:diguanylate cyclase (GGDEF)-like protein
MAVNSFTGPMIFPSPNPESEPLERFAVEVFSELNEDTIVRRCREVNVLLRMSMLTGLEMELDSTLNLVCDMAAEIVGFARAAVYFWEENGEGMHLRASRNLPDPGVETFARASILNYWAAKLGRPLLLTRQSQPEADALLRAMNAASVVVVPLFVRNRVVGAMQLFGERADSFSSEDVQLLWMLSLVAESMLARDYSNETLLRFAFTDFLTGLKTRGYFEQQLDLELARAERRGTPVAVLMIDIDHFKRLNDTHGHPAGDLALHEIAAILSSDLRQIDIAARYGGEEFILLLPETTPQGAKLVAQRLRYSVEQAKFRTGNQRGAAEERLTISIGVALFPEEARCKRDLLEAADAALYAAKAKGRNRVVFYSEIKSREEAS